MRTLLSRFNEWRTERRIKRLLRDIDRIHNEILRIIKEKR